MSEITDFVEALRRCIVTELRAGKEAPDYNAEAIEVVDARNHLFRNVGIKATDEAENIYALRDLCRLDEDMELIPDDVRMRRVACNFFGSVL